MTNNQPWEENVANVANVLPYCSSHTGPHWRIGNVTIIADKETEIYYRAPDLLFDCANAKPFAEREYNIIAPKGYESLTDFSSKALPRIAIPFADFSEPKVSTEFWPEMVRLLKLEPDEMRLGVFCMGGHGRTGTVLACLRIAAWNESAAAALDRVRTDYCRHAVESATQLQYIRSVAIALGTMPKDSPFYEAGETVREAETFTKKGRKLKQKIYSKLKAGLE